MQRDLILSVVQRRVARRPCLQVIARDLPERFIDQCPLTWSLSFQRGDQVERGRGALRIRVRGQQVTQGSVDRLRAERLHEAVHHKRAFGVHQVRLLGRGAVQRTLETVLLRAPDQVAVQFIVNLFAQGGAAMQLFQHAHLGIFGQRLYQHQAAFQLRRRQLVAPPLMRDFMRDPARDLARRARRAEVRHEPALFADQDQPWHCKAGQAGGGRYLDDAQVVVAIWSEVPLELVQRRQRGRPHGFQVGAVRRVMEDLDLDAPVQRARARIPARDEPGHVAHRAVGTVVEIVPATVLPRS